VSLVRSEENIIEILGFSLFRHELPEKQQE